MSDLENIFKGFKHCQKDLRSKLILQDESCRYVNFNTELIRKYCRYYDTATTKCLMISSYLKGKIKIE